MDNLPIVTSCDGCCACCLSVGTPPGYGDLCCGIYGQEQAKQDYARIMAAPAEARKVIEDVVDTGHWMSGPCCWLDQAAKRCRWHDWRPDECRRFEVGGESCRHARAQ